jgi:DNA-binding MarR family transcriptional regulator
MPSRSTSAAAPPARDAAGSPTEPATAEDAVMTTMVRLGRKMRQRLPGEDLDFAAIVLMKALHSRGSLRLSSLAAVLDVDASTVSRQVRHLEERGLLERSSDPVDARASLVCLTDLGAARLEAGAERRRAYLADLLGDWPSTDREQLRLLLNRLLLLLDTDPEH